MIAQYKNSHKVVCNLLETRTTIDHRHGKFSVPVFANLKSDKINQMIAYESLSHPIKRFISNELRKTESAKILSDGSQSLKSATPGPTQIDYCRERYHSRFI